MPDSLNQSFQMLLNLASYLLTLVVVAPVLAGFLLPALGPAGQSTLRVPVRPSIGLDVKLFFYTHALASDVTRFF